MADEILDEELEDEIDEELDDDLDDDLEDDEELDTEEDEEEKEETEEDDYDDLFAEEEEFTLEGLDLESIEGYNSDEDTKKVVDNLAKELHTIGVGAKQIKPVIEYMDKFVEKIEDEYSAPIKKEDFLKMSPENRTAFRKLDTELRTTLSKEERGMFLRMFNSEEKIGLAVKLIGGKAPTGKTD